jgi:hypothetical protein
MAGRAFAAAAVAAVVLAGPAVSASSTTLEIKVVSDTIRITGTAQRHWETDRLYDGVAFGKKHLKIVGSDRALVVHRGVRLWIRCDTKFARGTLHAEGYARKRANGVVSVPVRSGTGRFAGMRGTLLIWDVPGEPAFAENVYRLR